MDEALQFPGVSNAWTMPIRARIDMLSTGIRTPVGVKVFGTDLAEMEKVARQIEAVLKTVPGTSSAYAERVIGGYYLDIVPDRTALGRYGLTVGDVQDVIATALGGEAVTTTVEGRERYGVTIRYPRDLRSEPAGDRPRGAGPAARRAAPCRSARSPRSSSRAARPRSAPRTASSRSTSSSTSPAATSAATSPRRRQAVANEVKLPPGYLRRRGAASSNTWSGPRRG